MNLDDCNDNERSLHEGIQSSCLVFQVESNFQVQSLISIKMTLSIIKIQTSHNRNNGTMRTVYDRKHGFRQERNEHGSLQDMNCK